MTDWNEYEDAISDAICDSIDMDWTSRTGAKAVVAWLNENAPAAPQAAGVGGIADVLSEKLARRTASLDEALANVGRLKLAICGGEDVPGAINAVTVEDCERFIREERLRAPSREPEGGAVPDDVRRLVIAARNVAFDDPTKDELRSLDIASEAFASRVPWDEEPSALTTSEEAPTNHHERNLTMTNDELIEQALSHPPLEAPAEAGVPSLVDWFSQFIERHQEGCGSDTDALIACLDRVRDSYRAQPPAREDAQPVAKVVSAHGDPEAFGEREIKVLQDLSCIPYNTPLYTHPTPDALREAVEALEKIADARVFDERGEDYRGIAHPYRACRADETEQVAIKALAALQAEQGAK